MRKAGTVKIVKGFLHLTVIHCPGDEKVVGYGNVPTKIAIEVRNCLKFI